jgi:hypothetical protein
LNAAQQNGQAEPVGQPREFLVDHLEEFAARDFIERVGTRTRLGCCDFERFPAMVAGSRLAGLP